ncbi:SGNH hydrolase-type esterase domain-containing protein [Parachaetomium inaequale]|uniref:SGNH hydrolase-type esterase domain-containing protein n=1 Tax=Parachaetomium inaequale TaxID=2588326 RepID=A0AAN6SMP0_9PEZI|nr:SGNH hydrolase-type esterase domain-containing protein [Parachaetomium inaequale]
MTARPRLRILCFGDSLTAGYASWGAIHHPYNEMLESMLSMAFPDLKIVTAEDGLSGATVKHGFQTRMNAQFLAPRKKKDDDDEEGGKRYDWTIVLGGTNDLGMGFSPEQIFESLQEVWNVPLAHKCKVLALTVPEAGIKGKIRERIDAKRDKLNALIKGYKREGFHVFDLNKAVPYWSMTETDRAKYWDDHLHFTPDGYDLIGNKVGMALVSLLATEKANDPQRPQKRRRLFRGDDKPFDEEAGDPAAIDQGYVVVRRVDLE